MKSWSGEVSRHARHLGNRLACKSAFGLVRVVAVCCAAWFALPAVATLTTPTSVALLAPGGLQLDATTVDTTPISATQTVSYGLPITPDATQAVTDIRFWMLPGEQIALSGDSIRIRAAQGNELGYTGYLGVGADHARYVFSGLSIAGSTLTGFNFFAFDGYGTSGFSGVLSGTGVSLIDTDANSSLDTLIFNLDELLFVNRGNGQSNNFAEFQIDILSTVDNPPPPPPPTNVPEPGTLALASAGLLAVRWASQRRAGGKSTQAGADHA